MPSVKAPPSNIERAADASHARWEPRLAGLLRGLRATRGRFALLPLRSDYPASLRKQALEALEDELRSARITLHRINLTRQDWDPLEHLPEAGAATASSVYILLGLEDTPRITAATGEEHLRPPALSQLNLAREALRARLRCPLIVWCTPLVYDQLREHAPDLFDHYTALPELWLSDVDEVEIPSHMDFMGLGETLGVGMQLATALPRTQLGTESQVSFCEERLSRKDLSPDERVQSNVALAMALLAARDDRGAHSRACRLLRDALPRLDKKSVPEIWAQAHFTLAGVLQKLANGQGRRFKQAQLHFASAQQVWAREAAPRLWAGVEALMAELYAGRHGRDRHRCIVNSIEHYQNALTVFTLEDDPDVWAALMLQIGWALLQLQDGAEANAQTSIDTLRRCLLVFNEESHPPEWAWAQSCLGLAYARLVRNGRPEFEQAIASHEAALRVYQHDVDPEEWARQHCYVAALYGQRRRDAGDFRRTIDHLNCSLDVWSIDREPERWARCHAAIAMTKWGLATYGELGIRASSIRDHLNQALRGFELTSCATEAQKTRRILDSLPEYLTVSDVLDSPGEVASRSKPLF